MQHDIVNDHAAWEFQGAETAERVFGSRCPVSDFDLLGIHNGAFPGEVRGQDARNRGIMRAEIVVHRFLSLSGESVYAGSLLAAAGGFIGRVRGSFFYGSGSQSSGA
jgi:hypothetical protein